MLLNTIFLVLISARAFCDRDELSERIVFKGYGIANSHENSRSNLRSIWPFKPETTKITFFDEPYKKDAIIEGHGPNLYENPNNRRFNVFNQNNRFDHHYWHHNRRQSTKNYENINKDKKNNVWDNYNRNDTFTTNGNIPNNWNRNTNQSKRRLLPENSCGVELPRRILGGTVADIDEYPWMALVQYRDRKGVISYQCGGTLISSRYVITAAHCTTGPTVTRRKLKVDKIRLGEWDTDTDRDCQQDLCSEPVQDIEIEDIIIHPGYNPRDSSQKNDISLIRLKREAEINDFVQPICLPLDDIANINFEGKKLSVAGWGKTTNKRNSESNVKMKVDVPVVSWDTCRNFYESYFDNVKIDRTQMCAGGENGQDSCQGDSGGPLMGNEKINNDFRWILIGIVSTGPRACGGEGRPSIYTKVSDYTDWILDNMRE